MKGAGASRREERTVAGNSTSKPENVRLAKAISQELSLRISSMRSALIPLRVQNVVDAMTQGLGQTFRQHPSASNVPIVNHAVCLLSTTWILKSIYPTQNVQGPSPAQQKKLLGMTIVLNARTLKACGQSIPVKVIKVNKVSSADFLEDNRVSFSEVGIEGASIIEIVINNRQSGTCFGAFPLPGQDIYVKNKNEILVYFEGVFYRGLRKP